MRLVFVPVAQGLNAPSKYRLKDADSGIVYPNPLTAEQIHSPVVHEAATTYIKMKQSEQVRLHLTSISPLLLSVLGYIDGSGGHSGRLSAKKPSPTEAPATLFTAYERKLMGEVEQLKVEVANLQERNDRQARIIKAVQCAVRGDVQ